jgi:hypothetical protein
MQSSNFKTLRRFLGVSFSRWLGCLSSSYDHFPMKYLREKWESDKTPEEAVLEYEENI